MSSHSPAQKTDDPFDPVGPVGPAGPIEYVPGPMSKRFPNPS